ncbi:phosphate ABC transporter permease PstA [Oscillatoria sp. FACHB-1406]|uniref:phosphate ABC transporter permease PstA n=1 Tax=Oscillatoria sp. FACHB-1406 TaxID=2692846 RepID=UPI0016835BA8|nr:phosphate ABC transporter permease PstA [Oscillatoria sp. FACHB-1406]MBD2578015.1 phosphate ABC transporter permease PstA [Oscillatoria sp. FACHB-1406]
MSPSFEKSGNELYEPLSLQRSFFTQSLTVVAFLLSAIALLPLLSLLSEIITQGIGQLRWEVLVSLPAPLGMKDVSNGFANAILGTLLMVFLACLFAVPLGIIAGICLAELGKNSIAANILRFSTVILSSVPSIIVGVFAYGILVLTTRKFSALAGGFALGVIMLPIIALTTEEALKLIPKEYRLASSALGASRFYTIFRTVLPAALPAVVTGILLAIARAAGETAPLLFTALSSQFWPPMLEKLGKLLQASESEAFFKTLQQLPATLVTPTPSMSVLIYSYAQSAFKEQNALAWTAALVLIGLVLITNILSRLVTNVHLKNR